MNNDLYKKHFLHASEYPPPYAVQSLGDNKDRLCKILVVPEAMIPSITAEAWPTTNVPQTKETDKNVYSVSVRLCHFPWILLKAHVQPTLVTSLFAFWCFAECTHVHVAYLACNLEYEMSLHDSEVGKLFGNTTCRILHELLNWNHLKLLKLGTSIRVYLIL